MTTFTIDAENNITAYPNANRRVQSGPRAVQSLQDRDWPRAGSWKSGIAFPATPK